jgi:hypothetical protein
MAVEAFLNLTVLSYVDGGGLIKERPNLSDLTPPAAGDDRVQQLTPLDAASYDSAAHGAPLVPSGKNNLVNAPMYVHVVPGPAGPLPSYTDIQYWWFFGRRGSQIFRAKGKCKESNVFSTSDKTRNFEWRDLNTNVGDWKHVTVRLDVYQGSVLGVRLHRDWYFPDEWALPGKVSGREGGMKSKGCCVGCARERGRAKSGPRVFFFSSPRRARTPKHRA